MRHSIRLATVLSVSLLILFCLLGAVATRALPQERVFPSPEASVQPLPSHELRAASLPSPQVAAPSRRPRLLVLGDSILFGGFGLSLEKQLQQQNDVWLYGSCGASSISFLRGVRSECGSVRYEPDRPRERIVGPAPTPRVDTLLQSVQPDAALLVLGTNFLCCASEASGDVRALVDRFVGAHIPCLWVGVPSFRNQPSKAIVRHYSMLAEAIGDRCSVLDARTLGFSLRDVGDNVHVEPVSGHKWAEVVVEETSTRLLPLPFRAH